MIHLRYKKLSSAKMLKDKSQSDLQAILGVPITSSAFSRPVISIDDNIIDVDHQRIERRFESDEIEKSRKKKKSKLNKDE